MITTQNQSLSTTFTEAIIDFKDGSKRIVLLLDEVLNFSEKQIQFVASGNRINYLETNNPFYIETIEKESIDGINIDLK